MTVPDAILAAVVDTLPDGAYLWDGESPVDVADLVVFDSIVPPTPPRRYIIVDTDTGTYQAPAVASVSDSATFRWQVMCIAPDAQLMRALATTVKQGLVDRRMVAEGWALGLIRHTFGPWGIRGGIEGHDEQVMERPVTHTVDHYSVQGSRVTEPVGS